MATCPLRFPTMRALSLFLLAASSLALASIVPHPYLFSTGTLTLTLHEPTPTQTDAAVTSAYAKYAQTCGPDLAKSYQDGLAQYNQITSPPATSIDDPGFQKWLKSEDTLFTLASFQCQQSELGLLQAEDKGGASSLASTADNSASSDSTNDSATSASTVSAPKSSSTLGSVASRTSMKASSTTDPSATRSAPSSTQSKNAAAGMRASSALMGLTGVTGLMAMMGWIFRQEIDEEPYLGRERLNDCLMREIKHAPSS
ncbi:hypothetical protein B0H15DRAFT_842097, partial [Mycena belliarum]